jgi:pyruvate ferredoxin oxidoreductase delta subunit
MTPGHSSARIAQSSPAPGEAGRTGDWRSKRPVMTAERCLAEKKGEEVCQLCWAYCPDACISRGVPPSVELEYCKGCGICAEVCPSGALEMVPEDVHGVCQLD